MEHTTSMGDSLATRTTSDFPVSIGTGLCLRTLFESRIDPYDPQREIPPHVDVSKYHEIWINLTTLIRNISGAMTREAFLNSSPQEIKMALEQEIDVINSLFQIEGNNLCKPIYYFCTYDTLMKKSPPQIKFREDKTEFQKAYRYKLIKTLDLLFKSTDEHLKLDSVIIPKTKCKSMIISHIPYDLTNYTNFATLDLLESHTGKLKSRQHWNTKYFPLNERDMTHLPFTRKFLLIFGDKVLIQPNDLKLRRLIAEISVSRNWTPMTTEAKVKMDLEIELQAKDPFLLQFINNL